MEIKYQTQAAAVQNRVSSNQTAVFEAKITRWYEDEAKTIKASASAQKITVELQNWEDLYTIPDTAELLQALHKVPFYRYMIRYLVYTFSENLEKEAKQQGVDCSTGWEERYAGYLIAQREQGDTAGKLDVLTDLVWNAFSRNGCKAAGRTEKILGNLGGTKKWNREDLKMALYGESISSGTFFLLAFGLQMEYEDLTMFLKKVLKRSELNLWNMDEFLIYICFRWLQEGRIAFYQWGKQLWKDLPAKKSRFVVPEKTAVLHTELDQIIQAMKDAALSEAEKQRETEDQDALRQAQTEQIPDAMTDLLSGYKYLLEHQGDYKRSALKCAGERLAQVRELCQEDMEEYLVSMKEEQKVACGNVRVFYDASRGITIPEGTRFYQKIKGRDGRQEIIWYRTLTEVSGKPAAELETDVNVICTETTRKHAKNKDNVGYLPNKTSLQTDVDGIQKAVAFHALAKPVKKKADQEDAYHVTGTVRVTCTPGTKIPEGTPFYANGFTYLAAKDIVCDTFVEVPVRCEKENWEATINQIRDCESHIEGMTKVGNTKISLRAVKDEEESRAGGSLYRYLYTPSEDLICGDNSISDRNAEYLPEILEGTMLSATKLWQIEKQKNVEITRNDILTLSFLAQMAEIEFDQSEYMEIQAQVNEADRIRQELFEERYTDFLIRTNQDLTRCGFQGLYLANPYDTMLAYLTTCSEPLTAFRNLWAVYLDYKKNNNKRC